MSANYDGFSLGRSVQVDMIPNPDEFQLTSFFGVSGVYSLWGGGRGRIFNVRAVAAGTDESELFALRAVLLSYADGIGRVFAEREVPAVLWPDVVFTGIFRWSGNSGSGHGGVCRPYEAVFAGRI